MLTYLTVTLGIIGVAKFLQEGIPQQVSLVSPLAQSLLFYMDIISQTDEYSELVIMQRKSMN
jgi:hypothetical protein